MPISDPSAVRYCNEKVRPAADKLAQAYYYAKIVLDEWNAENYGSTSIPIDGGTVEDGADVDGRKVIDGNDVHNLVNRLSELITDYEASTKAKLNTILNVAVNEK